MIHRRQALRALAMGAWARPRRPGSNGSRLPPSGTPARTSLRAPRAHGLSELIIPETDTPGAKAAKVNEFIDAVLADADRAERRSFIGGLSWIDARSDELFGAPFVQCAPEQQTALLTILSSPANSSLVDRPGVDFFRAIKAMTITGYYTSELGMKSELGDDGVRFFADYPGCQHPAHKR